MTAAVSARESVRAGPAVRAAAARAAKAKAEAEAAAAAEAAAMRVLKVADMMMAGGVKVVGVVESSPRWW